MLNNHIIKTLKNCLKSLSLPQTIVVALSGGRDSHVLLHALAKLRSEYAFSLKAIHINHGLISQAPHWQAHCEALCQALAIPIETYCLLLSPQKGDSIEALAREARYQAFAKAIRPGEYLLTAHHQLDQAETVLLQLLRGAGPMGISAMPSMKPFAKGYLLRPLLLVDEKAIQDYAIEAQLAWVEDPSNQQTRFTRNRLRHLVIPELKAINPSFSACISRSAKHCAESQLLLESYLTADLNACLGENASLNLEHLKTYPSMKQPFILRHWLKLLGVQMPESKQLNTICQQFLEAAPDATPYFALKAGCLQRYKGHIHYIQLAPTTEQETWTLEEPLILSDGSFLQAEQVFGRGISTKALKEGVIKIRYRQGGERCRPSTKKHSRPLKKLLQEYEVPLWQRNCLPLLYCGEELIAVGGLFVCEGWQVNHENELGWVIQHKSQHSK